jgi:hypothetical protein
MSDILNCIRVAGDAYLTDIRNKADFKSPVKLPDMNESDMANTVTLDLRLDPDPYGYHKIPLTHRLIAMGWPVTQN